MCVDELVERVSVVPVVVLAVVVVCVLEVAVSVVVAVLVVVTETSVIDVTVAVVVVAVVSVGGVTPTGTRHSVIPVGQVPSVFASRHSWSWSRPVPTVLRHRPAPMLHPMHGPGTISVCVVTEEAVVVVPVVEVVELVAVVVGTLPKQATVPPGHERASGSA